MLEIIKKTLKNSGCDGYQIVDTVIDRQEYYFIANKLDQNRLVDTRHITVKVFKNIEDGKYLGMAEGEIFLGSTEKEIEKIINELVYKASLAKNKPFPLVKPNNQEVKNPEVDVDGNAKAFIEAFNELKEKDNVNSHEIFTSDITRTIINSNGVNVTFRYPRSMIEVVTTAKKENHEIELYRLYNCGNCNKENLTNDITETIKYGHDKLVAVDTPNLVKYDVVFSTDAALSIYDYFIYNMSAAMKYQGYSNYEIGKDIYPNATGDKVTVTGLAYLENSAYNFPFDEEGSLITDKVLIKDNIPTNYFGSNQFASYMELKDASNLYNFKVEGGKKSAEQLRTGNYLEIVEFSDFQVDEITGDIAGEIRLGYLHQDGKTTIVNGGSVSGNMSQFGNDMELSKELRQYNSYLIPAVTKLKNVSIAGCEK